MFQLRRNVIENPLTINYFVGHEREGQYLEVPFCMPAAVESVRLEYSYEHHHEEAHTAQGGSFTARSEQNIIDLGLITPGGMQVGASGSDKNEIFISETNATPGYHPVPLIPGEWRILLGAYKVAPQGVKVQYKLTFTLMHLRWLKGDLHTHTLASDGVLSVEELARHALRHGLDFLAITDHNQMVAARELPQVPGVTLIPGVEWTHYLGHANFLGVDQPYDSPFHTNQIEEIQARFQCARERGALIVLNHPYEEICPFKLDFNSVPFDCIEVWNGPMREANLKAVGLWQNLLVAGKRIPICGGSDYHRSQLFLYPGGPTTVVRSNSASPAGILSGLCAGHAYITFAPDGPELELSAGSAMMGDRVDFNENKEMSISASGLKSGDTIQVVSAGGSQPVFKAESDGSFKGAIAIKKAGFTRVEIWRSFVPGLPQLPALISNPIYYY